MPGLDVVYTWVNDQDKEYWNALTKYSTHQKHQNPERYRDPLDLLKFSLRSLRKYFCTIKNIYLVTARPQVPPWYNQSGGLKLVHHDQIFDPEYLPTFNHNTIESYLHRIPGISERFIYMNDDFFFGSPVTAEDFFDPGSGRINIFGSLIGEYSKHLIYDGHPFSMGFIEHSPVPILEADANQPLYQVDQSPRGKSKKDCKGSYKETEILLFK